MVHVEQTPLGCFEQNSLAIAESLVKQSIRVCDEGPHPLSVTQVLLRQEIRIKYFGVRRQGAEHAVLTFDNHAEPLAQMVLLEQLAHAHATHTANFVLIAGPDTPAGRADALSGPLFT